MKSQIGFCGALGVDSFADVPSASEAALLKSKGAHFVVQYLGVMTPKSVATVVGAGLGLSPVTVGSSIPAGSVSVAQLQALGLPPCTVWLDVEGSFPDVAKLRAEINAWSNAIVQAGYTAGIYVGAGCPFNSTELYQLAPTRYWKSFSKILDRSGQLAEPACGWCQYQLFPTQQSGWGMPVDVDVVQEDYRGRLPTWVAA